MAECVFDYGEKCKALTIKDCYCCTFRKTKKEFDEGIEKSEMILKEKGLKCVFGDKIVTVEKI